jgi:hypothetical protein
VSEYQARVPIRTYDELRAEIDRIAAGGANVLTAAAVGHFEPTSGSQGASKLIPYTEDLRGEFQRAIAPWACALALEYPSAFSGHAYWSLSPAGSVAARTAGGIRVGFDRDEEYLGARGALVRATQAVPDSVRSIEDIDDFRRTTLRHLVACRSLSFISVWHPSFLTLLVEPVRDTFATWPHLAVISCWADGPSELAAQELARRFPHAVLQPKGLLSTEGVVSIPIGREHLLAYRSHFVELRNGASVVSATSAAPGRYEVILTTGGGLYRYATDDLVDVMGYRDECPVLRFVGRASHVSDHFGEKLHEVFVREQIARAFGGHVTRHATLAFAGDRYELLVDTDAADDELPALAFRLDELLRESFHYDYCRKLGQLESVRAQRATEDLVRQANGRRLGDIKPSALRLSSRT